MTLDEGTAEVAHEVLIRRWPTLRRWLDEDREGIRLHRRLGDAARLWDAAGREPADLYRGTRLDAAVEFARSKGALLNATERDFVNASVDESARTQRDQLRANRRLRRALVGAGLLLLVAVGLLVFALASRRDAVQAEGASRSQAIAARASSQLGRDPQRALLLARAALGTSPTPEAQLAVSEALDANTARSQLPSFGLQGCQEANFLFLFDRGRIAADNTCDGYVVFADLPRRAHRPADSRRRHLDRHDPQPRRPQPDRRHRTRPGPRRRPLRAGPAHLHRAVHDRAAGRSRRAVARDRRQGAGGGGRPGRPPPGHRARRRQRQHHQRDDVGGAAPAARGLARADAGPREPVRRAHRPRHRARNALDGAPGQGPAPRRGELPAGLARSPHLVHHRRRHQRGQQRPGGRHVGRRRALAASPLGRPRAARCHRQPGPVLARRPAGGRGLQPGRHRRPRRRDRSSRRPGCEQRRHRRRRHGVPAGRQVARHRGVGRRHPDLVGARERAAASPGATRAGRRLHPRRQGLAAGGRPRPRR